MKMSAHVVTGGIPVTPAPAMFVHVRAGSGDGSGMIFRWEGPPVAPNPESLGTRGQRTRSVCAAVGMEKRTERSAHLHLTMAWRRAVKARGPRRDRLAHLIKNSGQDQQSKQRHRLRAGGGGHSGGPTPDQARPACAESAGHRSSACRGYRRSGRASDATAHRCIPRRTRSLRTLRHAPTMRRPLLHAK
jgi:hypothetical protein